MESKFIKFASHIFMFPLAQLYNLSINLNSLPPIWKLARVLPVFKGGKPDDLNNYRPTPIICTV